MDSMNQEKHQGKKAQEEDLFLLPFGLHLDQLKIEMGGFVSLAFGFAFDFGIDGNLTKQWNASHLCWASAYLWNNHPQLQLQVLMLFMLELLSKITISLITNWDMDGNMGGGPRS